jgi:hypothetical protein
VASIDATTPQVLEVPIRTGADDAEERFNGNVVLDSADLDMTADGKRFMNAVGLRFTGIIPPRGAVVTNAYVQFRADQVGTGAASLAIRAQAADNAAAFAAVSANLTSRPTTSASASWAPPQWLTAGAAGEAERTSNLSTVIQEVLDRPGWASGNALVLLVTGTGNRPAQAFEGATDPILHIEWHL